MLFTYSNKHLPAAIGQRISSISSNKELFNKSQNHTTKVRLNKADTMKYKPALNTRNQQPTPCCIMVN